ncbi:G-protein coupled receptor Mth2 [Penaeus vannamei]|uniref:G-protein coupled receptor Mth2 n=1 Tax=Penaeus vannamei TaxID=6689 RepID=UPI00387F57DA
MGKFTRIAFVYRNLDEVAVKEDLIHPDTAGNATVPCLSDGTCRNETILKDDYIMVNDTVVIKVSNRTYYPGEYEVVEGVLVCSFASDKYSAAMGWVTLAGLSASSLCLVLHLVAFALVPHLRNLHGRNVASLSASLLGPYVSYILSVFAETSTTECYVFAVLIYYLFLTSFSWMNVLGFDVFYTFRRSRVRSGEQWKRFLVYSAYGWVLPACAVAAVVAVDQTRPPGFPPEFLPSLGQHLCWFGRRKALLAFSGAPLIASIIMNVALFVATTVSIAKTMQSEVRRTSSSEPKKEFLLYLRLAVLMGITWITSVVASYLELEVLWYVFILLNTLQGVFIFLAFTCRVKVWEAIAQPCQASSSVSCCRRQESEPPASDQ